MKHRHWSFLHLTVRRRNRLVVRVQGLQGLPRNPLASFSTTEVSESRERRAM
jgi:hypothetical protein